MSEPVPVGPDESLSSGPMPTDVPDASAGAGVAPQSGRRERRVAQDSAPPPREGSARSWLDHPATLVLLSVLALITVVLGIDAATQGRPAALLPALLVVAAYVVVLRRRRSARR